MMVVNRVSFHMRIGTVSFHTRIVSEQLLSSHNVNDQSCSFEYVFFFFPNVKYVVKHAGL